MKYFQRLCTLQDPSKTQVEDDFDEEADQEHIPDNFEFLPPNSTSRDEIVNEQNLFKPGEMNHSEFQELLRNHDLYKTVLDLVLYDIKAGSIRQQYMSMKTKLVLTQAYRLLGKMCYN